MYYDGGENTFKVVAGLVAAVAAIAGAPVAHADGDAMYRVGTDIQPGEYQYKVDSFGIGSWMLCSTANCDVDDIISMDQTFGAGHTGYFTVTPDTKFVKINELIIAPA